MKKLNTFIVSGLLAIMFIRIVLMISVATDTYDEMDYLRTGWYLAQHHNWNTESTIRHPSLSFYLHGIVLNNFHFSSWDQRLFWARFILALFSLILGFYIYRFAKSLYGQKAGLLAVALFSLSPNIIAHSGLITTDILLGCFMMCAIYTSWRLRESKKPFKKVLLVGIFMGLALLSKFTAVMMLVIMFLLVLAETFFFGKKFRLLPYIFTVIIGLFILNAGYSFKGTFEKTDSKMLRSSLFTNLNKTPILRLLPEPYIIGFDRQQYINEIGHPAFLDGKYSYSGWWYYFPKAFFYKEPLPLILMIFLFLLFFRQVYKKEYLSGYVYLALPVIVLCIINCFLNKNNAGYRYLLPVFPFIFVFISGLAELKIKHFKPALILLLAWFAVDSALAHPYYIAYFNEIAGGAKNGYKHLVDSNLDWGQDRNLVIKETEGKQIIFNPRIPVAGNIVINANNLQDVFKIRKTHRWLKFFKPSGNIGYSWLVYDLKIEDFENLVKEYPQDSYARYCLGSACSVAGRNSEALEQFAQSIKLNPEDPYVYNSLGQLRFFMGNIADAERQYLTAVKKDELLPDSYQNLAELYGKTGRQAKQKEFQKRYNVYRALDAMAFKTPVTVSYFSDKVSREPENPVYHNNLGFAYIKEGGVDKAIAEFSKALELDPYQLDYYANLVYAYNEKGDLAKAKELMQLYLKYQGTAKIKTAYFIQYGEDKVVLDSILLLPVLN
ncbi:MAG: hypothetical protein A2252_09885 [Elusimicrobia bacterium RIFOXYA2_FULL_39_19]|nr:MAG: hypothetical protein A2252_09885 [Elusimicrobia bacterium RIFOXYA2_FULL_39_19]